MKFNKFVVVILSLVFFTSCLTSGKRSYSGSVDSYDLSPEAKSEFLNDKEVIKAYSDLDFFKEYSAFGRDAVRTLDRKAAYYQVKFPQKENGSLIVFEPKEKPESFFSPINSTDSNILKTCNKMVVDLIDEKNEQIEIINPKSLSSILLLIYGAESTTDHKCGSLAKLKIISGDSVVHIDLLPGHKDEFYEFRYGGFIYKINRIKFTEINEINEIKEKLLLSGK